MSFYDDCSRLKDFDFNAFFEAVTASGVRRAIHKPRLTAHDFLNLLSPAAENHLEEMAQKAHDITIRQFGKIIFLFTPMYLSNYCTNHCVYCGFKCSNHIARKQLSLQEVATEARAIAATGMKQILILTGEAPKKAGIDYLKACCEILRPHFPSIAIEIYALETGEYETLIKAGVDAFTMFQETYNEPLYETLHPQGPKKDYRFRLDAPERACRAGMRGVNIGALLGLDEWRREVFLTALHADYLQKKYPEMEISISLPRIRPHVGSYTPACEVSDRNMVQIMTALRLFLPRCGITISTREKREFRDHIMGLGVTKMSAGVTTAVGGHTQKEENDTGQFDISDERSVDEMCTALRQRGFQPVFKDWEPLDVAC